MSHKLSCPGNKGKSPSSSFCILEISAIFHFPSRNFHNFPSSVSAFHRYLGHLFIFCLSLQGARKALLLLIYLFLILDYLVNFHLKKVLQVKNKNLENTSITKRALDRNSDGMSGHECFLVSSLMSCFFSISKLKILNLPAITLYFK